MTVWSTDFMHREAQLFPKTIGEVVAALLRKRFPRDTAKHLQRRYTIDPSTAKNIATKSAMSERSLTSVFLGEGDDVFELLDAIGHALTGKTRLEWEEQKLQRIIDEANRAQASIERLRARRLLAEETIRPVEEDQSWSPAGEDRRAAGGARY